MLPDVAVAQTTILATAVANIIANPRTTHAVYALEVIDLDAHRVLFALNPHTFASAASTTKLVTEGVSLMLLGPDFRWTTPVYRTGTVARNGMLHGDLVLVGSGDPNLSQRIGPGDTLAFENQDHTYAGNVDTKAVPGDPLAVVRELATQVRAAGITSIDGVVTVDTTLFPETSEGGTGLTVSPIIVNDNAIDVTVTPGARPGDPAAIRVSPQTPYATFTSTVTTGAPASAASVDMSSDVVAADGHHVVTMTGSQPAGPSVLYVYPVSNPALFARFALAQALADAGIGVRPPSINDRTSTTPTDAALIVAKHVSPPLSEDTYITLKVSQNLHAHLMPYMWSIAAAHARAGDIPSAGFGAAVAALQRAGVGLDGAVMQDGEGSATFFTPDFMVGYLQWASRQPWFRAFVRGLPILGRDGTLAKVERTSPAAGKVFAKTGTIGSPNALGGDQMISKGLAGYMTTSHGRHVAFAFYLDHIQGPASENTGAVAGHILGSLATATYLHL